LLENRVLRGIFVPKRVEVIEGWKISKAGRFTICLLH